MILFLLWMLLFPVAAALQGALQALAGYRQTDDSLRIAHRVQFAVYTLVALILLIAEVLHV